MLAGAIAASISLYWDRLEKQKEFDAVLEEAREAQLFLKNPSKAKVLLQKAIRLEPGAWEPYYLLGRAELGLDQVRDATAHLEAALKNAPADAQPSIQLQLGQAYRRRYEGTASDREFRLSRNSFERAAESEATRPQALHFLGMLWVSKHDRTRSDIRKGLSYLDQVLARYQDYPDRDEVTKVAEFLHSKFDDVP